jgi:hypothetical protein
MFPNWKMWPVKPRHGLVEATGAWSHPIRSKSPSIPVDEMPSQHGHRGTAAERQQAVHAQQAHIQGQGLKDGGEGDDKGILLKTLGLRMESFHTKNMT